MSSAGEEMKEPQRDVPRVVLLSGLIISVAYMLGALGILLVVPLEKLSLTTGTWDALAALGPQWGAMGEALTLLLGIGFLYACIANVVTWSLGVNRVAAIAAEDHMLPGGPCTPAPALQDPVRRLRHHGRASPPRSWWATRCFPATRRTSSG